MLLTLYLLEVLPGKQSPRQQVPTSQRPSQPPLPSPQRQPVRAARGGWNDALFPPSRETLPNLQTAQHQNWVPGLQKVVPAVAQAPKRATFVRATAPPQHCGAVGTKGQQPPTHPCASGPPAAQGSPVQLVQKTVTLRASTSHDIFGLGRAARSLRQCCFPYVVFDVSWLPNAFWGNGVTTSVCKSARRTTQTCANSWTA